MIGSLRGTVLERIDASTALIEAGGVGYLVTVTPRALADLHPGTTAFVYVHHHIREDGQTLFGFLQRSERAAFQVLIATHGIGPSLALAILATHSPSALVDIVAGGDLGALTLVPGVGKKTAERLLVELRNRLDLPVLDAGGVPSAGDGHGAGTTAMGSVREALAGLGYGHDEIRDALRDAASSANGDAGDASTLLREALKVLGSKRA
ncbi:MAG: Holliday junction branch migration protein RuvA [Ilumatobacteraceae bacterium]|jgi:Holliday junction DNA helicase RuvA